MAISCNYMQNLAGISAVLSEQHALFFTVVCGQNTIVDQTIAVIYL
jgi:hypothetical protein